MLEITNTGIVLERLDAILRRLALTMRTIYGQDINLNADTPDGQLIGILSQGIADINEVIGGVYAMSDPYTAVGQWLDVQAKYVGISRNRATYSYLNSVQLNVAVGTIIPEGYIVTDENNTEWVTTNKATATSNTLIMEFRSSTLGAYHLATDKALTPKTIVLGAYGIVTTSDSSLGQQQETDTQLLARFLRSYNVNNLDDREGLEASLLALNDVKDAKVYENYTGTVDARGVQPHTINTVVIGGSTKDIAETIWKKKALGCGLQGSVTYNFFYEGLDRLISFDRASKVNISATVTVVRRSASTDVDVQAIKDAIARDGLIDEDFVSGTLYCGTSSSSYSVKSITLSSGALEDVLIIPINLRQYGSILPANVEVIVE